VNHDNIIEHFENSVAQAELPSWNMNQTAKFLLSKAMHARGVKVVLTGDGSDESFVGYPWNIGDYMRYMNPDFTNSARTSSVWNTQNVNQPRVEKMWHDFVGIFPKLVADQEQMWFRSLRHLMNTEQMGDFFVGRFSPVLFIISERKPQK